MGSAHDAHRQRTPRHLARHLLGEAAILSALDGLIDGLADVRRLVETDARAQLHTWLTRAREARTNLPGRITDPESVAEFRIPIPDRPGAAAELFTLAAHLGVNIASFRSCTWPRATAVSPSCSSTRRSPTCSGVACFAGVQARRHAAGMTGQPSVRTATVPVDAMVDVPGSKSIANRALVCAVLADGRSVVEGVPSGDDTAALVECLGALGITVSPGLHAVVVDGRDGRSRPVRRRFGRGWPVRHHASSPPSPRSDPARTSSMAMHRCDPSDGSAHDPLVELGASVTRSSRPVGSRSRSPDRRPVDGSRSVARSRASS